MADIGVQAECDYPFDHIPGCRDFVPRMMQDACVPHVYVSIPVLQIG